MSVPHFYVAVHGGAGVHKRQHDQQVKQGLLEACSRALQSLSSGARSLEAVEAGICALEDDPSFNAGFGSNLTFDGRVECDAAIMEGTAQDFGSVGAVSGVKNPIKVAREILKQSLVPDGIGRILPMTLVADGAKSFAKEHLGEDILRPPEQLISPKALKQWATWRRRLEEPEHAPKPDSNFSSNDVQDTVGAVTWSSTHGFAAGASSGGLLLKHPGRIGQVTPPLLIRLLREYLRQLPLVPVVGHNTFQANAEWLAVFPASVGEEIIRTSLAQQLADSITKVPESGDIHGILKSVMEEKFAGVHQNRGQRHPNAGVILLTAEDEGEEEPRVRLWCAFTTESMAIAYASSRHPVPKAKVLRRDSNATDGLHLYITSLPL